MEPTNILWGFFISIVLGGVLLWFVVDVLLWGHLSKKLGVEKKEPGTLSVPLGAVERLMYTTAFIVGAPEWVGVWLAIKVAVQWHRWTNTERGIYNTFLIGNAVSIFVSVIGASIATGKILDFTK